MDPRELGKSLAQRGKRPGGGLRLPVVLGKHFRRLKWCIEQPVRVTRLEPDDARIRAREAYIYAQRKGRSLDYGKHWGRPPTGNVSSANWKRSRPSPRSLRSRLSRFFPRACPRFSKAPGPRRAYPS